MSKMKCKCGHVIIDQTDFLPYKAHFLPYKAHFLPYKAHFLPDEDVDNALDPVKADFAEFIEARERGEWEQYAREKHISTRLVHEVNVESMSAKTAGASGCR